jgi:N6-adenosine-specific RNA methylase IME4
VVAAWGFSYATKFAWAKDKWGLGYWNRTQHELLLVGVRGNASPSSQRTRTSSLIQAPCRRHSQKPDQAVELLERLRPQARKLELFARGASRPGWTGWGNEADNG